MPIDGHESWIGAVVRAGAELVLTADYAGRVITWDPSKDESLATVATLWIGSHTDKSRYA